MQRRLSYAAAAGGASVSSGQEQVPPARSGSFAHIMNPSPAASGYEYAQDGDNQSLFSRQQHMESNIHTASGGGRIPYSWGKGGSLPSYWSQNPTLGTYVTSTSGVNTFISPSYLRGTKYLEKLEAAHNAKIAAQREAAATQPISTPASLSASSSSVSLHRMAPSHRGMTYDIVENHPKWDDDTVPPLPSKWANVDRFGGLEVFSDGQDIRYLSSVVKTHDHEAAAARTDFPMPPQCGIYYYEVTIQSKGKEG